MARIYVDRYTGRISRSDLYLVTLTLTDGTTYENLEPRRLFPLTNTEMYVSLLDAEEHEVALVRDLAELDETSAAVLRACFLDYYRIPRITRLIASVEESGVINWEVETNFGHAKFRIANRFESIKPFGKGHVLVRDTNDNRYLIDDVSALDVHSRYLLFPYL